MSTVIFSTKSSWLPAIEIACKKFYLMLSYLRSKKSKFLEVKHVNMSLPVKDLNIVEYIVTYPPYYNVYPRLVFINYPIPPDCCKLDIIPINPPIGFCCG